MGGRGRGVVKVDQNKVSIVLIALGTAMLIAAGVLFAIAAPNLFGGQTGNSSLETVPGFGERITPPTPGPTPTPSSEFPPGDDARRAPDHRQREDRRAGRAEGH